MVSWAEICASLVGATATTSDDDSLTLDMQVRGGPSTMKVFITREVIKPDFEIAYIRAPFARVAEVDMQAVVTNYGQMCAGAISFLPISDDSGTVIDGILSVTTSIPLQVLDLTHPAVFLLYVNIVANSADHIANAMASSFARS